MTSSYSQGAEVWLQNRLPFLAVLGWLPTAFSCFSIPLDVTKWFLLYIAGEDRRYVQFIQSSLPKNGWYIHIQVCSKSFLFSWKVHNFYLWRCLCSSVEWGKFLFGGCFIVCFFPARDQITLLLHLFLFRYKRTLVNWTFFFLRRFCSENSQSKNEAKMYYGNILYDRWTTLISLQCLS